jgi:hypothetical protein
LNFLLNISKITKELRFERVIANLVRILSKLK